MTTTTAGPRHRQLRIVQIIFAGAAAIGMLALFDAARPDTTQSLLAAGLVRLVDRAFATDDSSDQAQQQEQLALQEMQQSEQQAEEQNEAAEQQFEQSMQQAQTDEQQANDP